MKFVLRTILMFSLYTLQSQALGGHDHVHMAKHNMILIGNEQIFASHLVYKQPHNFQVILELYLPEEIRTKYLGEKEANPEDTFIFLMDTSNISQIQTATSISGSVFRKDKNGVKHELEASLILNKDEFKVLYFDELPLSLNP